MSLSITSTQAPQFAQTVKSPAQQSKPAPSTSGTSPDSVTLSAAARKALSGGDVDHDGDSH